LLNNSTSSASYICKSACESTFAPASSNGELLSDERISSRLSPILPRMFIVGF
jgi:hypothetical protein